ncbi:MAG TPA: DUF5069 domain-containing protein [Chthoniobacterales bacterium]
MSTYPVSPKEMTAGLMYFPRMLDKIRMHGCDKLPAGYHENFGKQQAADGMMCNLLRVEHAAVCRRVQEGGSDEEILEWCYANGRRLNEGDIMVWNGFIAKLGWNDFATRFLEHIKHKEKLTDRTDIQTIPDFIDLDEGRLR